MHAGDTLIAVAKPAAVTLEAPAPPTYPEAEAAGRRYPGLHEHPFAACFVCGTERPRADGLRIFPGPLDGRDVWAAPWVPHGSLAGEDGFVRPALVWAALDCPGAWAIWERAPYPMLLGRLTAELVRPVRPGGRHMVVAWRIGDDGRKHYAGTALFTEGGDLCGVAKAVWIDVAAAEKPGR